MKTRLLVLLLVPSLAMAWEGAVPQSEMSLGGVAIGQSRDEVIAKLGKPTHREEAQDFLDLHYDYPHLRVSFNTDIVAGLESRDAKACTAKGLCPGDKLEKMRSMYGAPKLAGTDEQAYVYYGPDGACWLEVPAKGRRVTKLSVVCMP